MGSPNHLKGTVETVTTQRPGGTTHGRPAEDGGLSRRRHAQLIIVLGSLIALGPLTIDMYLPAFPQLADDLNASAASVQLTLTGMLGGLAFGQLVIGPLSDAFGRRKPLITGLVVHGLASLLCALAPSIAVLSVVRVLQGLATHARGLVQAGLDRARR